MNRGTVESGKLRVERRDIRASRPNFFNAEAQRKGGSVAEKRSELPSAFLTLFLRAFALKKALCHEQELSF